jgi:CubicO group peptidase (beta-lactamase class C family)
LLSHTGGLASDPSFSPQDTDEYVNAIARYVDRCFLLPQVHEQLGQRFSYSNAGYVIAGRLVEVVSAVSWRQAVEERIFKPLGMRHALANPAEVLRFRAAIGHLLNGNADAKPSVVSVPYLPMSMAPTGSVLTMSASDLLRFGRAHLSGGKTEMGARWMSQQSAALMRAVHVDLPGPCLMSESRWGLGWALSECQGVKMFGHSGGSGGQQAFLGILPEHDAAFSVQLNGMTTSGSTTVLQQVSEDLLYAIAGARAENPRPVALTGEPSRFTGRFAAAGFRFDVTEQEGQLYVRVEVEGYADLPAKTFRLTPVGENRFTAQGPDGARVYDCIFLDPNANGAPEYLFYGYRLHRRVRP